MNTALPSATRGHLLIVSAPSGAGKTSLVKALLDEPDLNLRLSVSTTTRAPRPGECNGREYHFTSPEDFLKRQQAGEFLEWAQVHGNHYGTSARTVADAMAQGHRVILEIDWQGAQQVRGLFPAHQRTSIFILPPSIDELRRRLEARGQDLPEVIAARLAAAEEECSHAEEFDHVIMNQHFSETLAALRRIISATAC